MRAQSPPKAFVSAARNDSYTKPSLLRAMRDLLDHLVPPLPFLVKRSANVLVKVNMGCSGARDPNDRFTTHPALLETIIRALQDCGAVVSFGDDVARAGKYCERIWNVTGMSKVARATGASLIDFVSPGAREVRGDLLYPRSYLVTNAYFEADVVINAANFRSHAGIGVSGAIKNMFGCVIGLRKTLIHNLCLGDSRKFGRAIADIHRTIPADLSFLDLTSVLEGHINGPAIRPVGLILAGTDPVSLDALAMNATGYENLPVWTTFYGNMLGLGCSDLQNITIRGVDWNKFEKPRLKYPKMQPDVSLPIHRRIRTLANHTFLRPRPIVDPIRCNRCGDCEQRCPVRCIVAASGEARSIDLKQCADCGCCLKVCEADAVRLQFVGAAKAMRLLANRLPDIVDGSIPAAFDPAPR